MVKLAGVIGSEVLSTNRSLLSRVWPRLGPRKGGGKTPPPSQRLRCEVYVQRTPAEQPNVG